MEKRKRIEKNSNSEIEKKINGDDVQKRKHKISFGSLVLERDVMTFRCIIATVGIMFIIFVILYMAISAGSKGKLSDVITESFISGKVNELNELAVSKAVYEGVVEMEDSGILFKNKFIVKYTGSVKSHVDMSKADIKIDDKKRKISVSLPHAVVDKPNIDSNYQVYDTSWIKSDSLKATTEALKRAEEDCEKKVDKDVMIATADGYAKDTVENLLSSFKDITEPYSVEVQFI